MDKDVIKEAQDQYKDATDAWSENYKNALDDLKFARLGEQWPDDVLRSRQLEGRPCLTINKMPSFIRQVVNDARQNKPSIKTHPVDDSGDVETSEVINGIIRNIEYTSNADVAYDTALESAVSCGFGFFRICTDYSHNDSFDQDIKIERIANPLSVTFDPSTMAADSSDWNYAFVSETYSHDAFKRKWPGAKISDFGNDEYDEDWITKETVRVAEWWTRKEVEKTILKLSNGSIIDQAMFDTNKELILSSGVQVVGDRKTKSWKCSQKIMNGVEVLEENEWGSQYIPIIPVYGDEVIVEGKRHFLSLIRFAKDPQIMFNYWRTAATELVALAPKAPFIGPKGAFNTDQNKWATANTKSHPFIEFDGNMMPQRQPFAGVPAGVLQEAMSASDDMKAIMGIYDASLGARSNETSGKAIMARQREGDISTFHFIDNLSRAIRHAGRILVELIPQVYTNDRVVRILGEGNETETVKIGEKHDPDMGIYNLSAGKYDLVVNVGPSFTTRREEAATQIMELIKSFPGAAPLVGDIIAKNLDWPEAEEIGRRLKIMLPPQLQDKKDVAELPPEAQAMIQSMTQQAEQMNQAMQQGMQQMQQLQAENQGLKNQIQSKEADKELKNIEAGVKGMELEIKRQELDVKAQDIDLKRAELGVRSAELAAQGVPVEGSPMLDMVATLKEGLDTMAQTQAMLAGEMARPKQKVMKIQAPSGQVYTGEVVEG